MSAAPSTTESRALELLSTGIEPVAVAGALGVSESRISQLLSDPAFATQLAEARFKQLAKHNATDNEYDVLEQTLLEQLKRVLPLATKPMEIARVLGIINNAKRRGSSSPDSIIRTKPTIQLNIPIAVVNKFQLNAANQVIEADVDGQSQTLVTLQSGSVQRLLNEHTKSLPKPAEVNRYNPAYRQPERNEETGVPWRKRLGREQNLMAELGFTTEVTVTNEAGSEPSTASNGI